MHVKDLDCLAGCRRLIAREAIFAGGSSGGGVLPAVETFREALPRGLGRRAVILPDRGERYLETLFADDWVREQSRGRRETSGARRRRRSSPGRELGR